MIGGAASEEIPRPALLIVEDDVGIREVLIEAFREHYQLLTASDGTEAFQVLASADPVAMLLDLGLPDIDGREILASLARRTAPLPIIVLTARPDVPSAVECMKLGALDYFTKPFRLPALVTSVEKAAGLARSRAWDKRILFVGGDRGELAAISALLETRISSTRVASAGEALPLLARCPPCVVVLFEPLDAAERQALFDVLRREHPTAGALIVADGAGEAGTSGVDPPRMLGFLRRPYAMAELVARIVRAPGAEMSPMVPAAVVRSAEYVSGHYKQSCQLEDAAAHAGVSASHLAHLFHSTIGMTWRQFVARTRLALAREYLADPRNTLEAVAELVGFCDAPHLSRVFKRELRQSPGQFRRLNSTIT